MSLENRKENRKENSYVKNSIDYSLYNHDERNCEKANCEIKDDESIDFNEMDMFNADCLDLLEDFDLEDLEVYENCNNSKHDLEDLEVYENCNNSKHDLDDLEVYENCNNSKHDLDEESNGNCNNSKPSIKVPHQFFDEDPNELIILGFFNDFNLVNMGIHDFIREVYFED